VSSHNRTVGTLRGQLNAIANELTTLKNEQTNDETRKTAIAARTQVLTNQRGSVNNQLARENANYASQLNSLDTQIRMTEENKTQNEKQDQRLLDNVATVSGSIVVRWISVWDTIGLYLPSYWPSLVLLAAAVAAYLFHRRRLIYV
jgi:chromosome segregation ATPase